MKVILPTLGDFANGIFAVLLTCFIFNTSVLWWYFPISFALSLLPDIDAVPELLKYGQVGKRQADGAFAMDHRSYLHYPLVYLALGLMVVNFSYFFGVLFLLAVTLHFLRDLVGTGWGVKLFWPVSRKNYKLFTSDTNAISTTKKEPVVSWTDEELPGLIEAHGDEDWIEKTYLRLTWISGVEYTLFAVAVLLMVLSLL